MAKPKLTVVSSLLYKKKVPTVLSYCIGSEYNEEYEVYDTQFIASFDKSVDKDITDRLELSLTLAANLVLDEYVNAGRLQYTTNSHKEEEDV